jgi:membrane protease YdiL (CAAX protease family)
MVIGYLATWAVGLTPFSINMTLINIFGGPLIFVITVFVWAIGEEIGWRGFLQPRLTELLGLRRAFILTGVVWIAWHYSFFIYIDSINLGGNFFINLVLFTIGLVFVYPILIGSMRAGSGSLWPAVLWHATWNIVWIYGQEIFGIQHPGWSYVGNDSGIVCLLVGAILIFWTWRQLPISTPKSSQLLSS